MRTDFLKTLVVFFLVFISLLIPGCKKEKHESYKDLPEKEAENARDTFPLTADKLSVFEEPDEQIESWIEKGLRGITLILVDVDPAIGEIPEKKIVKAGIFYKHGAVDRLREMRGRGEEGMYNAENYLYLASKLGIVKDVYWITPFDYFRYLDSEDRFRRYLQFRGFEPEDIVSFRYRDGCVEGSLYDLPYHICSVENLPDISGGNVSLTVDLAFFPTMRRFYGLDLLEAVSLVLRRINEKGYKIKAASIVYSVNGGHLAVEDRYIGDVVKDVVLSGIDIVDKNRSRWREKELSSIMIDSENFRRVIEMNRESEDIVDMTFRAIALAGEGEYEGAFRVAENICKKEVAYCYIFPRIGGLILSKGDVKEAGRFFKKAFKMKKYFKMPGMWQYAMALFEKKNYSEALKVFNYIYEYEGSFRADFMAGLTCMKMNDPVGADFYFDRALRFLKKHEYDVVWDRTFIEAVKTARKFYRDVKRSEKNRMFEIMKNLNLQEFF